jgi:hypothetical protein
MKNNYGQIVWKLLQEYAIWHPGGPTTLGDFGVIRDNCFERIGNIRDYITDLDIQTKTNQLEQIALRSDSTMERRRVKDLVNLTFRFRKSNGVLLSARDIQVSTFLELQKAAKLIAGIDNWDRSWQVVTSVRMAAKFVLVISRDQEIFIQGHAKEVADFMEGNADNVSSVQLGGAISLKMTGEQGPISVRLHQLKSRGDSFRHLERGHPDKEGWVLAPFMEPIPEN